MNWAKKKILITGGAGFIGSCIAKKLITENADVTILDNLSVGTLENIPKESTFIEGDVCDWNLLSKITDVDYIFHFGAPSSSILFRKNQKNCITATINGLINLLDLSKATKVKKIIYPSSCTVYGSAPVPQSETAMPQPHTPYAISKLACEHLAKMYSKDVSSVGLRIFSGYGPQETHKKGFTSVVTEFLRAISHNEQPCVFGDGTQSRDFIYIDDIVLTAIRAAEFPGTDIINVGTGFSFTFNELIELINSAMNKNITPVYNRSQSPQVERTLSDTKKMKELLQINPIPLPEALKRYLSVDQKTEISVK